MLHTFKDKNEEHFQVDVPNVLKFKLAVAMMFR
jgi:hypothetical protein